jgi:spore germination protein GerM
MIGTNIGRKIVIALAALAAVVAIVYLAPRFRGDRARPPAEAERVSGETRSVTLHFGRAGADGFAAETREVPAAQSLESSVKTVIGELIAGSTDSKKVNVMPEGADLRQVFWVEDTQTLFLDFNRAFADNHPGGSAGEYYTIGAIFRTISANFPQVERVQFLIEGGTIESLAGHYAIDKPIDVKKWR